MEKIRKEFKYIELFETRLCDEYLDIEELKAILSKAKEDNGADVVEIYEKTIDLGCGEDDYDGLWVCFYRKVLESDEEYEARVRKIKKREEEKRRAEEAKEKRRKEAKEKAIEAEKEKLKELAKKYPDIIKNN